MVPDGRRAAQRTVDDNGQREPVLAAADGDVGDRAETGTGGDKGGIPGIWIAEGDLERLWNTVRDGSAGRIVEAVHLVDAAGEPA